MDKDILLSGNKEYSENTCVLVPRSLNMFLTNTKINNKNFKQGVSLHRYNGKFRADVNVGNGRKYLGLFLTEEDAHQAYKKAKEHESVRWHKRLISGEFLVDERVIERMRTWRFN